MSKPTIAQLQDETQYTLLLDLHHDEILPFVMKHLKKRNVYSVSFRVAYLVGIAATVGFLTYTLIEGQLSVLSGIAYTLLGIAAGTTIIIPFHEWIHGLAYKLVGAPKVSYGGSFKKMIFYAVADHFVIGMGGFRFVALAPFAVISAIILTVLCFVGVGWQLFLLAFLLSHTLACGGDFSLLSFTTLYRGRRLYTYDDVGAKRSFVFGACGF